MRINEDTYEITVSQGDYGIPIVFEADEESGFQIEDEIRMAFDTNALDESQFIFPVTEIPFRFNFVFTKEQAENLWKKEISKEGFINIPYSIKRYRNNQFLESLENENGETVFKIKVRGTVKLDGETEST